MVDNVMTPYVASDGKAQVRKVTKDLGNNLHLEAVMLTDEAGAPLGGGSDVVDVTLVLDTSAYASGDVLVVPQEVTGVFAAAGGKRALHSVIVLDEDDQGLAFDLVFFNASASLGTINSAVSISDADARKIIGIVKVEVTDYFDLVNSRLAVKSSVGQMLEAAAASTSLWVGAIARAAPTHTAAGIRLKLGFV